MLRGVILKSFPNPLTPAEEKYYLQRYTEGDLQAKHILIGVCISSRYNTKTEYERLNNRYIAESGVDTAIGLFLQQRQVFIMLYHGTYTASTA